MLTRTEKHEIELIIKGNGSLADRKIKYYIEQLLAKCEHRSNIPEHGNQQNGWTTQNHSKLFTYFRLKNLNKLVALQNLSIDYNWKIIRKI